MKQKQYGFIPDKIIEGDHWMLGGYSGVIGAIINPSGNWMECLPDSETQRRKTETQSCVSFGALNQIEMLMWYKYKIKVNYSDRFLAIMSETNPYGGNSPHKVYETIRKYGCIPEEMLPFTDDITTPEQYHDKSAITQEMLNAGKKWSEAWDYKHEWAYFDDAPLKEKQEANKEGLKRSPVALSVAAWYFRDGKYYKPENTGDNHWIGGIIVGYEDQKSWLVLDSYPESEGDFIKELEWDYNFSFAKIIHLEKKQATPEKIGIFQIFQKMLNLLAQILRLDLEIIKKKQPIEISPVVPPTPAVETTTTPPITPSIRWGDYPELEKQELLKQTKEICRQVGLTTKQTQDLCKTIWAESGWNPNCVNEDSLDYGLCQFNIKWYLKPNNMTPEDALKNPLKCVRIMAKSFRVGRQSDWIAYRNGNYLKAPTKYYL